MCIKQHRNGQAVKLRILLMVKVTVPSTGSRTILHRVKTIESYWVHANESSLWKPQLASRTMEQNWKKYHIHFYTLLSTYFHSPSGMLNLGWFKVVNFMFLHSKLTILIYSLKNGFYAIQQQQVFIEGYGLVWFGFFPQRKVLKKIKEKVVFSEDGFFFVLRAAVSHWQSQGSLIFFYWLED